MDLVTFRFMKVFSAVGTVVRFGLCIEGGVAITTRPAIIQSLWVFIVEMHDSGVKVGHRLLLGVGKELNATMNNIL